MKGKRSAKGAELLKRTADIFDLPGEALMGEPRVTVTGTGKLHLENHRGLVEYGTERVVANVRGGMVKITGEGLTVAAMSDLELVLRGTVRTVEFLE